MSKKKNIIILTIIILLILIIFVIILLLQVIQDNNINETIDNSGNFNESNIMLTYNVEKVKDATKFFTVSECVNRYFEVIKEENKQEIYNLLDKEYIIKNNINESNILENNILPKIEDDIYIEEMNYIDGEIIQQYSVSVIVEKSNIYLIINLDTSNFTFSVKPIENLLYKDLNEIELTNKHESIQINDDNKFEYIRYSEEDIVYMYFEYYNSLLDDNYEKAYQLLDTEYRNLRFPRIEDFVEYINKTKYKREISVVNKYQIEENLEYNEYIIVDNSNDYYIIKEYSIMNFTIQLDNYTIKPDDYLEEYLKLSQDKQISTDINLFITMINNKDYNAAYNLLDDTFKKNNFSNLEKFKEYVDKEFFDYNIIEVIEAKNEGEIFIYNLKMKSGETNNALEKYITVIIKLKENSNFVISFSFK